MLTLYKLAAKAALLFVSSLLVFQAQSQCNVTSTWTFNPPIPPNGAYDAGTSIQMCVTMSGFQSVGANWLWGIQFELPPAFDESSIVSNNAPAACSNGGQWLYTSGITCQGDPYGPGFFYDVNSGGPQDGNPCNNWGDPCFGANSNWQFCFTVTLDSDCGGPGNPLDGSSIIPEIVVWGDGDGGSWGIPTTGCNGNGNSTSPNVPVMEVNCCDSESGGSPGNVLICQNGTYDLFTVLLPPVDAGGSWIGPAPWVGNGDDALFNPLTDPPGTYTYVVQGTGGCFNTTDINMVYNTNGVVQNIPYCGANPAGIRIPVPPQAAPLISPANLVFFPPGGTWFAPGYPVTQTVVPGGIVIPNVSPSGIYTYGYLNNLNCFTLSQVNMIFATGSASGCFTEYDLCAADPSPFSPFSVLGCNPQGGGQWIRYNENFGFVSFHPTFGQTFPIATGAANAIVDTTFFVYVLGTPPCPPGIDTVQVNFHPVINTGVLTQTSVCTTDPPFILETLLDGTVTPGQTWTDAFNPTDTIPNLFDPSIYPPGTFFQLQYAGGLANSLCFNATILQLTILPANANAGLPNTVSVCNTDASFNMTNFLLDDPVNGPPQGGGQWVAPNGTNFGDFFTPGLSTPGVYTYNINSTCDSDQATLTVNVTVVPNPGSNGTLNICSNATNIPLFPALGNTPGGPPVTGGTWSPVAPGGLVSGNNVVNGQVYTYTVGTAPCNASATVTINLIQAPNAGVLAATPQIFCSNAAAINLMNLFTTPPSLSNPAFWSGPGGFTGGTLNPATATTGTYTYTIPNTGCGPASVSLTITIEPQPNAGLDATVNACPNGLTPINLVTPLGPGITTPGVWTNTVGGPTNGTFTPGTSPAGVYTYTVSSASGTCTDFANITVNYLTLPNPGTSQILNICSNAGPLIFNLINSGQSPLPSTGGIWLNPSGVPIPNPTANPAIFTPGTSVPGNYTYIIPVAGGCPAVTAVHTINVTPLPNAGINATTTRCASFGSVDLTSYLGGTPASIGTWTDLSNNSSVTNPLNISGLGGTTLSLQYSITTGPCTASSTLTLTVQNIPNAGTGNSLAFCSNSPSFNLNTGLTGSPNGGGTWVNTTSGIALTPAQALAVNPATLGTGATFVYTVTPSSCPSVSATVPVTITPVLTISGLTTTCQPNQNFYTVTFTVTGGQAPINIANGTLTGGVFTSNPIAAGTAYGFIVQDASTCADLNVNGASPICTCPASASFGGSNQTICLGGTANIPIVLAGAPPYNVTYNNGTGPITLTGINAGFIWNVSPTGTTTYTLVSVADANCTSAASSTVTITVEQPLNAGPDVPLNYCATGAPLNLNTVLNSAASAGGTWTPSSNPTLTAANSGVYTYTVNGTQCPNDVALYTLNINPPITVSLVQAACQPNQTNYVVTFTIAGGQSPYSVNGIILAGNTFTSALQPVGSPFPYAVEDSGPCAAVNGNVNSPTCTCPATAAFGGGNQTICAGGTALIPIILTGSPTYNVTYAVGGANAPQLLGINNGFLLSVSPTITTTYTLVSMNDANCAGSAIGSVTITVEQPLNAGPDVSLNYCATGAPLNLNTVLNFAASAGGTWTPSSNPTLTAANSGVYTYTVNGTQCPNDVVLYTLNINPPITVSLVQAACQPNQTNYVVTFTIAGGQSPYSVNGITLAGNTFTSALQPVGSPFPYAVEDSGPCAAVSGNVNSPNCNCPATAAFGGGNQTICAGGTANIPIILTGTPAYNVTYAVGGANAPQLLGINNGFLLSVSPSITTTYTLIGMNDANCAGSANGSITIIVDNQLNAGPDVISGLNYCAGGPSVNLNTLLNASAYTPGTWTSPFGAVINPPTVVMTAANSGNYTYAVGGNACPSDASTYTLNIAPVLAFTGVLAACTPMQTAYTVSFNITGGTPPYFVNGLASGAAFTSAPLDFATNPNYNFIISDNGVCSDVVVANTAPACNCLATGSISGSATICAGTCTNMTFALSGVGPFSVIYLNSNDPFNPTLLNGISNGHIISVCPSSTATYTLLSVTDANCTGDVTGNSVTVAINPLILATGATTICNATNEGYQVQVNISGGVGPYSVNPAGTLNTATGVYLSPVYQNGTGYSISIDDAGACPAVLVQGGAFTCPCVSSAGTLPTAPQEICLGGQLSFSANGNAVLDGNDGLQYVLHSGSAMSLGSVIATSNTGSFTFNYLGITAGNTYYVNVVVGNTDAFGNVNLNHPCTAVSTGAAVSINAIPSASISGSDAVCVGEAVDFNINFTGDGPWDFQYAVNGAPSGPNFSPTPNYVLTTTQVGNYTLIEVSDSNCTGTVSGNASLQNFATPAAVLTGNPEICENSGSGPQVNITGASPYTLIYAIDGVAQAPLSLASNIYTIPATISGVYSLVSLDDNNCSGSVSGILDVTIQSAPTASLLGGGAVCEGDAAAFTLQLTGEGPWNVQYTVDGVPQGSISTNNSNYTFESGEGGNYGLVSIQDANCQGDVLFSQASLNINPKPSAEISTQNSIFCIGQEVALSLDIEGVPPFVVTYVLDGDTITASGIFGDIFQTLTPTSSFSAEVLFVSDGSNPTCTSEPMAFEFLSAVELPNAPVLTDVQSCASEGAQQIGIAGAANLSYSWSPADHLSDPNIPNPTFSADIPGIVSQTFQYVLSATNGDCAASDTMTIVLHPSPRVRFEYSPQPIVSEDPSVRFENKSSSLNPLGYVWEFGTLGSSTEEDPIFVFPDGIAAEYSVTLTATDQITGCVNQWTDILSVRPQLLIFVPNAFTPDGDGLNDLWGPVTRNVDGGDYRLTVFSRLGDIVFETRNPKQKWNGSLRGNDHFVEAGVYVWKIETKNELTLEEVKYQGNVTVVR